MRMVRLFDDGHPERQIERSEVQVVDVRKCVSAVAALRSSNQGFPESVCSSPNTRNVQLRCADCKKNNGPSTQRKVPALLIV
ncbi:hypothetical protein Q31a_48040 [Aureliella helgolandensis]|uniref:Uncharacterized protein n=1 Tax=Aureliella helgolandensis TaxID=2527968 RepID=A0A518GD04_9BACT|nr:hypothetical protein Q31a_48040 [Aureliella helgolandensis]